jgi:hypothetical protein
VGEQGRAVGEQLALLLPGLDPARQAGIALVTVDEARSDVGAGLSGSWYRPDPAGEAPPPAFADDQGTPLSRLMVEALRGQDPRSLPARTQPQFGVLDDLVVRRIHEAGYVVPRAMVVVWVAAAADSPAVVPITGEIRRALASEDVEGWVLLALTNIYPRDPKDHAEHAARCRQQAWEPLLVDAGRGNALATYAYLFESHGEHGTFWEGRDDVPFAAAEAIFVLTASGITTTREFEETLRQSLPQHVRDPYERLSGVGTSRLTFPRGHVEAFAAHRLGANILREWARSRTISLPLVAQVEHKRAAQRSLAEVRKRVADVPQLERGGRSSPRVSADTIARVRGLDQPTPDGGLIFKHFRPSELRRLDDGRLPLAERLEVQRAKAEEGFPVWKSTIRQGWERYGQEIERKIVTYTDGLILEGPEGVTRARAFTEELNRQLTQERDALASKRESREIAYERYLRETEALCHGPWAQIATAPAAHPASASAAPELIPAPATAPLAPVLASMPLTLRDADASRAGAGTSNPSGREEALAAGLATRHAWITDRVPRWPAVAGVVAMMVPAWVLVLQQALPSRWMSGIWSLLLLTLAVAMLTVLCSVGYYDLRRRREQAAAADLRRVYRRMFAHRCERHEDERREALLVGLQARVRRMLDRLADWDSFATSLAVQMEEQARQIEHQLFDGALGRRDVVVANRQLLHPVNYNLHRLDEDLAARRRAKPLEGFEWHASASAMLEPLRDSLRGEVSLMGAAPESIVVPVREFCQEVVRPYIAGDIVDLGAALEAWPADQTAGLFDHLIERSIILYHPVDRPRAPLAFVAARDEHHDHVQKRSLAANMITLTLNDREWMGVLRLQSGGSFPSFHDVEADRLQFERQREDDDPLLSHTRSRDQLAPSWEGSSVSLTNAPTRRIVPQPATWWSTPAPAVSAPLAPRPPASPATGPSGPPPESGPLAPWEPPEHWAERPAPSDVMAREATDSLVRRSAPDSSWLNDQR